MARTGAATSDQVDTDRLSVEPMRVSKRTYISAIARRTGLPVRTVAQVYEAAVAELMDTVIAGHSLMLTGLGRFYAQKHRGHRVQFTNEGNGEGQDVISDYTVLKFSAARQVSRRLDDEGVGAR